MVDTIAKAFAVSLVQAQPAPAPRSPPPPVASTAEQVAHALMPQPISTKTLRPRGWKQSDHISSMDWRYSPLFNYLDSGEFLSSNNGKYHLVMESSGDLTLYHSWTWIPSNQLWCSNSAGRGDGAPYTLEISLDRSAASAVHITSKSGAIVWDMGVRKEPTANCLSVSDEGKIVVSDFFRCEIFHTIEPAPKPRRDTFAETAFPSICDAMATTIAMQDAILACATSGDAVAVALTKAMPTLLRQITTAETAAKTIMQDLDELMSMAFATRPEIATMLYESRYDPSSLSATAKALEQQYDAVLKSLFDVTWFRERAERMVKSAEEQHELRLQRYREAHGIERFVADTTWDISTDEIDHARHELEMRKNDEMEKRKPLNALDAQLVALYMRKYGADGRKEMATLRLAGLELELDALRGEYQRYLPVQQCVFSKCLQFGNPTRVLKREPWPSGFVTMTPLICALKDIVNALLAAELLGETERARLQIQMSEIESKGEQIKQRKIESCKALEEFFY
ncbi:hypothetical protein AMAG_06685 [Allomyces macrogynus ATCC 38327]|uniref:Bulb-type lectin domain-containing protein n=1 Tax=Allomyces macrogynus (strain ATCC 38327) TaxID=578462 RepID=A0A0L0SEQ8_ALLM3|nr:hypothetical protein AMAG_06685 [Allomyces macrogynus ATCC 38327]|eukprot:KNE60924.1 hypothetical protein AMAG_06685 [Allomyces macrogynus ATCC 38327]